MFISDFENDFSYRKLISEKDRQVFYRLRYREYVLNRKWEPPNEERLEKDEYDEFSHSFGWFENHSNILMAASRLIDGRLSRLPLENYTTIKNLSRNSLEISRFIVRREIKTRYRLFFWSINLFNNLYLFGKAKGYEYFYAFVSVKHFNVLKRTYAPSFEQLGPEEDHKNDKYICIGFDINSVQEHIPNDTIWRKILVDSSS